MEKNLNGNYGKMDGETALAHDLLVQEAVSAIQRMTDSQIIEVLGKFGYGGITNGRNQNFR
jgi:hypothetical protein